MVARCLQDDPEHDNKYGIGPSFDTETDGGRIYWKDRKVFGMNTPQGQALLASPNSISAASLLIQHKSTFGDKRTIDAVTIWCQEDEEFDKLNLMFHVSAQVVSGADGKSSSGEQKSEAVLFSEAGGDKVTQCAF